MSQTERIYEIDRLLKSRSSMTSRSLREALEISSATLKRDLSYLRDRLNAPIIYDRNLGGYRFDREANSVGKAYELPGLWFSAEEIHALLTMQHLLANLDTSGLLGPHIKPLLSRLTALLGSADNPSEEVIKRIRILSVGARRLRHFRRQNRQMGHAPLFTATGPLGRHGEVALETTRTVPGRRYL